MSSQFLADFKNFSRTWSVETSLPVGFYLKYSPNVFSIYNRDLCDSNESKKRIVIIDENVYAIHKPSIEQYAEHFKIDFRILELQCSEYTKEWTKVEEILNFFEESQVLRRETIYAVGGGVLLDIVGFAASIYRRGIPYIKIPTTLLSIVDASVGSKVGINHFNRRNRLGSYYPPLATLIDRNFIKTEDERFIINGLGEIFKLAVIKSHELFNLLDADAELLLREKFQHGALPVRIINVAISEMINELSPNLWEKNLERCVDFGHTFSPVVEMNNSQHLMHGEAVALDCIFTSILSYSKQRLSENDLISIISLAKRLKLPIIHPDFLNEEMLLTSLLDAKTHRNGRQNIPIPIGIGSYDFINDVSVSDIQNSITLLNKFSQLND